MCAPGGAADPRGADSLDFYMDECLDPNTKVDNVTVALLTVFTVLVFLISLPQNYKLFDTKSSEGISLTTVILTLVLNFTNVAGGIITKWKQLEACQHGWSCFPGIVDLLQIIGLTLTSIIILLQVVCYPPHTSRVDRGAAVLALLATLVAWAVCVAVSLDSPCSGGALLLARIFGIVSGVVAVMQYAPQLWATVRQWNIPPCLELPHPRTHRVAIDSRHVAGAAAGLGRAQRGHVPPSGYWRITYFWATGLWLEISLGDLGAHADLHAHAAQRGVVLHLLRSQVPARALFRAASCVESFTGGSVCTAARCRGQQLGRGQPRGAPQNIAVQFLLMCFTSKTRKVAWRCELVSSARFVHDIFARHFPRHGVLALPLRALPSGVR